MTDTERKSLIYEARQLYRDCGYVEIDNDAKISDAEKGAWVQAWVWIDKNDA